MGVHGGSFHLSGSTRRRLRRRLRQLVSPAIVLAMAAAVLAGIPPAAAVAKGYGPPVVPKGKSVPVTAVTGDFRKPMPMPAWHPAKTAWPSGSSDVTLTAGTGSAGATASPNAAVPAGGAKVQAGSLPVWLGPATGTTTGKATAHTATVGTTPSKVHVGVAARSAASKAGVNGVLMSMRRTDGVTANGPVHVTLSYAQFRDAFGGDWGSRLRLIALPACALTTPTVAACRVQTPLKSTNNVSSQTLQADVTLPAANSAAQGVVLAASADTGGGSGSGDFTATSLKPTGSWQAGGSSDAFTWSYPIDVPSVPGDLVPKVTLSYDSQSQDGETSSTNNQASWIGDGWDYSPGFIERSYPSCHDNPTGDTQTWDNCWSSSNNTLTLSLNGSTSILVKDDTTGAYHPQDDPNEKVEYLTGASNNAHNGDYWRITTDDGTQYYFGQNQLPGWASGDTATNSVFTEPVFFTSSVPGQESCYSTTFADSSCQEAYRWNLDYVVDTHQDTIAYYYTPETNYYADDKGTTANASYTRGGYLKEIDYGQRAGQVYSTQPAAEVVFSSYGRCNTSGSGCATSSLTSSTASNWPDVPYDQNCVDKAACSSQAPSFWTENMLTGIQTNALVGATETPVDSWTLSHSFPDTKTLDTTPALWLSSITHTGQDTTAGPAGSPPPTIKLPATVFTGMPYANRVRITDGLSSITRQRMYTITTETGETITVGYSAAVCQTCVPSDPSQNTTLAYPDYWTPQGQTDPSLDWFNKYIVKGVTEHDPFGGSANDDIATTYTPVGSPAWHYNDDPTTPTKRRTWDQWRGYSGMTVSTGTDPDPVTKTTYTYLRGMNGDTLPSNGTRSASVSDSRGDPPVTDNDQWAGMTYETQVFNGSAVVTDTITDPYTSAATASQAVSGLPTLHAYYTGTLDTKVYTPLANGTTQETETDNTYDSYGRVVKVNDRGDVADPADDLCTTTSYADNTTTAWILNATAEVNTVSVNCSTKPTLPDDAVSDILTFYDNSTTLGAPPTVGAPTMTQQATSYTGSTPVYTTQQTTTVDQYGREVSVTDANNQKTTTSYTPATGAEPTSITTTDPLKQQTITTYDPLRDLTETVTDPAGYVTTEQYDALGRLTAVYKPGRAVSSTPSIKYTYTLANDGPSVVDTYTLNHDASDYALTETLYDSMLRAREVQTETPDNKRTVVDTIYNTDGWQSEVTAPYENDNPVSPVYVQEQVGKVPSETGYLYDQAGRTTADIASTYGTQTWQTTYVYGGNFTTTVPPAGATPTTTVTDARGRTTHLIQYHAGVPVDYLHDPATDYDDTTDTYYPNDKQATQVDPAGNTWSWKYDLLGHVTQANDPDTGQTTSTYDNTGQLKTVTDARGKQTTYSYDNDGRKTGEYDTTTTQTLSTANMVAKWTYDTVEPGLLTSSTSYSNGDVYTDTILQYTDQGNIKTRKITLTGENSSLFPTSGYIYTYGYNTNGTPQGQQDPAIDGLPLENVSYTYDTLDEPTGVAGSSSQVNWTYVSAVGYNELGQPVQYTMPTAGGNAWATLSYDPQTQALTNIQTTDSITAGVVDSLTYTYQNAAVSAGAGLLVKTVDKQNNNSLVDTQCYAYDYDTHLQQAWTATDDCAATPTPGNSATVGGPLAPYWQSWTYDAAGNRATQTDHDTSGSTANDTTTTYHYPAAGSATDQPHTLTSTTATGPAATQNTTNYSYDPAGNTTCITAGTTTCGDASPDQALTWNDQDRLSSDATSAGTTSYVYDADGNLVVRRDPGSVTMYLDDQQLVLNTTTNTATATRYYTLNGQTVAARSSNNTVQDLIPDRQGTDDLAINTNDQTVTRRYYTPFGQTRGTTPVSWLGDRGYVGGDADSTTQLENLGAREYDPTTGRFISADPLFESNDPTQTNGYAYAGNDPVTGSDPQGLCAFTDGDLCISHGSDFGKAPTGGSGHDINGGTSPKGGHKSATPAIPKKTRDKLNAYIRMVIRENPKTWNIPGLPANKAILVQIRQAMYGSMSWRDVGNALDGMAVSTIVSIAGAALCAESAGAGCLAAVGALAGIAGQCVNNCSDAETLALSAVVGASAGGLAGSSTVEGIEGVEGAVADTSDAATDRELQMTGMLIDASTSKGFFGMGTASQVEADMMGKAWVGPGYSVASDGKTLVSEDKLRQYRPPSYKPNLPAKFGGPGYQANFEWRVVPKGRWTGDGHLNVTDMR